MHQIISDARRRALAVLPLLGRAPHANRGTPPRLHWPRAQRRKLAKGLFMLGVVNNASGLMANGKPWRKELLHPRSQRPVVSLAA